VEPLPEISYTIAEARDRFASLVHDVETTPAIALTRRGKPVAVLMSFDQYQRLSGGQPGFWEPYVKFRETFDLDQIGIGDDVFAGLRDLSPGRDPDL
jgi:antitoxin Phd